jgi:hypothetical protein
MVDITNYYERMVALLAAQFQDNFQVGSQTNFQKWLQGFAGGAQDIQTQLNALQYDRTLYTAVGVNLDGIGLIVGIERAPDQSDDDYREAILFQIEANRSSGTPEDLIRALKFFTKANKVDYFDQFPAGYIMATDGFVFPVPPSDLVTAMQSLSPAGVGLDVILAINIGQAEPIVPFAFAGDPEVSLLYVSPTPFAPTSLITDTSNPLQVDAGALADPLIGGWFAEYGSPNFDTTGAGQFVEALQVNGNLPVGY